MKKIVLVTLTLMVGLSACAKLKNKKKQKAGNEIVSIAMRHTGCYGQCPDYTLELHRDGTVIYRATRFNVDSGVFFKNIGIANAMEIIKQFEVGRVDTCKDEYENRIADLPGLIYTINYKSTTKKIMNAHYGPPILARLRVTMDKLIDKKVDDTWHKLPPANH
jgi:(2Fe-2S) ferredoxin